MPTLPLISHILLWIALIGIGFLLLGTLRSLGLLQWRLDQLEATRPSKINREGLKPGKTAPDFTLPQVGGGECSLSDYRGRRVFLVFVQAGCQPCHEIAPELIRLQRNGELQVLVINRAEPAEAAEWADDVGAAYPVLVQDGLDVSKKFQVFATPFAFVIDEQGVVTGSGIVSQRRHIGFVLDAAAKHRPEQQPSDADNEVAADAEFQRERAVAEV
jgi:methylamine dehydrogenase accessory protein MauD